MIGALDTLRRRGGVGRGNSSDRAPSHRPLQAACPLIRDGDVYHILPQATGREWDGLEYFDRRRGEGVVFVFRPRSPAALQRIHLAGLGTGDYEVHFEGQQGRKLLSAAALQREGLEVALPSPYSAAIIHLRKVTGFMPTATGQRRPARDG